FLIGKDRSVYRFKKMYEGEETNVDEYDFSWIEGIGSTLGFLNPQDLYLGLLLANPLPQTELLCFEDIQTTILYKGPSYDGSCNIIRDVLDATESELQIQLQLYPNPTTSFVHLQIEDSELLKDLKYQWSDYTGKKLGNWQTIKRNTLQLDLNQLPKGLLFLTISDGQKQSTRKVVKME
ncbi:MAG: T9SS type A sorting domain-containing protein, partial [Bacteroidota bacterium]